MTKLKAMPPKLYLLIGYPGAGKTTVSKVLAKATGAKHLWADFERHKLFHSPTHSEDESNELYEKLNASADYLLGRGKSVVFDTNFNFYKDRQKLRSIALKNNAEAIVIWVKTPENVAKERAVKAHSSRNLYDMNMSEEQFNSIVSKLEEPKENEDYIELDDTNLSKQAIIAKLHL
jgi:predicted kinase